MWNEKSKGMGEGGRGKPVDPSATETTRPPIAKPGRAGRKNPPWTAPASRGNHLSWTAKTQPAPGRKPTAGTAGAHATDAGQSVRGLAAPWEPPGAKAVPGMKKKIGERAKEGRTNPAATEAWAAKKT
ncbi:hypothetical protein GCM10020221_28680 [Streptomyces thioluteus]|uniref:Uncharacterized protein n=1 Tax=Streptomyces thioluteus TaxID=66431 RepID=A0ABN3X0P5_STRTU